MANYLGVGFLNWRKLVAALWIFQDLLTWSTPHRQRDHQADEEYFPIRPLLCSHSLPTAGYQASTVPSRIIMAFPSWVSANTTSILYSHWPRRHHIRTTLQCHSPHLYENMIHFKATKDILTFSLCVQSALEPSCFSQILSFSIRSPRDFTSASTA